MVDGQISFSRPTRLALLAFYAVWFLVFIPGHTRGQLTLSGARCGQLTRAVEASEHGCCKTDGVDDDDRSTADKTQCAVCHYILGLDLPPSFSFDPSKAELLTLQAIAWSEQVRSVKKFDPFHSRGPPSV